VLEIRTQHFLDHSRQRLRGDAGEHLPPDGLIPRKAAACEDVIGVQTLTVKLGLCAKTADIANVMLRARVRATGQVNVHGLIEFQLLLQLLDDFERVAFGIRLRKLAVRIPGACNDAARQIRLLAGRPALSKAFFSVGTNASGTFGMMKFCQTVSRTSPLP